MLELYRLDRELEKMEKALRRGQGRCYAVPVTRQEIEQKMDQSAREYHDTHNPEIPEEIYRLARLLEELDH
jgi:hypothetical protein